MSEAANDSHARGEVTELLLAWRAGSHSALDELVPLVYPELRRLAHRYLRAERSGQSLQTSALVNEAFLRLVDTNRVRWRDRAHFLAVSAQIMRRILVDLARTRKAHKRGDGIRPLPLEAALVEHRMPCDDLVRLDEALNELQTVHPRKAQIVEMRFFGGLSVEETAETLAVSRETVIRDWRLARAWLHRALSSGSPHVRGRAPEAG